jgi:hypothetical protein
VLLAVLLMRVVHALTRVHSQRLKKPIEFATMEEEEPEEPEGPDVDQFFQEG